MKIKPFFFISTHTILTMKKKNALYINFNFCILEQKSNSHSFFSFSILVPEKKIKLLKDTLTLYTLHHLT